MVTGTVCFKQTKNNICNGLGEHPKNGTPYLFLQRLKVAIGTQLGFGEYVTITSLVPNLTGASWATGAPQRPRCRNLEGRFCTLGPRCDSHTSFKMKRSNVTVTIAGPLMLTHIVCHIFRMSKLTNFKLGTRMEDDDQPQAPRPLRSKGKVAWSRDQSEPCWPNAVWSVSFRSWRGHTVSAEPGGHTSCYIYRTNNLKTLHI